jgi:threonine/homoserine/homoserine lactone efflux protein
MILAFIIALVVGFGLSIPPGPIAVAVMRQALEGNYKPGIQIGLGAATMDTIYSMIAIFASSALVATLKSALSLNVWVMLAFQVGSIITLVVLGIRYLKPTTKQVVETEKKEMMQEERARKLGKGKSSYFVGIVMSVTNLASPTFLPTLFAVASFFHVNNMVDNSVAQCVAYGFGFGSGAALWFVLLLRTIFKWRARLSANFISRLYQFAGWSFILFAAILVFHIIVGTDWGKAF